jgi:hypothetical protein
MAVDCHLGCSRAESMMTHKESESLRVALPISAKPNLPPVVGAFLVSTRSQAHAEGAEQAFQGSKVGSLHVLQHIPSSPSCCMQVFA